MTSVVDPALREETAKHAPYAQWGWRVPFVFGAAISAALFFYYRWKVPESGRWQTAAKTRSPLKELAKGPNLRRLAQLFVVMSDAWFTLDATDVALLRGN